MKRKYIAPESETVMSEGVQLLSESLSLNLDDYVQDQWVHDFNENLNIFDLDASESLIDQIRDESLIGG